MSLQTNVSYLEFMGRMEPEPGYALSGDAVVLTNLERAELSSGGRPGVCVRYVGRGRESYRVEGRGIHIDEGQVMICSHLGGAEVSVPNGPARGTLGLCVFLSEQDDEMPWVSGPLLADAGCSPLGAVLERCARELYNPQVPKAVVASALATELRSILPGLARSVIGQAAAMAAAKASTRYEMVRHAHLAQAYLHSVRDRSVPLEELAKVVGRSPFQLLRAFQSCFGQSPADYHRRLRLDAVIAHSRETKITLWAASQQFGFADGSSFSHAYRRAFGCSPRETSGPLN